MNLQEILMAILESNSEQTQSPIDNINRMSNKLKRQISEYEKIQKTKKQGEQKHLLQVFFKVLDYIGTEVQEVKEKYENLDKQKMKEDKCVEFAKDIRIFRNECYYLRDKLREAKEELRSIKIQNSLLQEQQALLQKVYQKKSKQKDEIKYKTLSQFWFQQKKKNQNNDSRALQNQRKTQFDVRPLIEYKASTPQPYSSQNRLISTSQQARKHGKSIEINKLSLSKKKNVRLSYMEQRSTLNI